MRVARGLGFGLGLVLAAMTIGTAGAQVTAEQQSAIRANCRSDFMSKCSGVTPGGKEALQCLQKNVATLSSGCKTAVSATLPKPEPAPAAAAAAPAKPEPGPKVEATAPPAAATSTTPSTTTPVATPAAPVTANVAPKPAETAKPRTATRPPSSPPSMSSPTASGAKTAVAPAASTNPPPAATAPTTAPEKPTVNAAVALRACKLDLVRHCGNVAFGEGRKLACLNERAEDLTIRCRTALKVSAPIR